VSINWMYFFLKAASMNVKRKREKEKKINVLCLVVSPPFYH